MNSNCPCQSDRIIVVSVCWMVTPVATSLRIVDIEQIVSIDDLKQVEGWDHKGVSDETLKNQFKTTWRWCRWRFFLSRCEVVAVTEVVEVLVKAVVVVGATSISSSWPWSWPATATEKQTWTKNPRENQTHFNVSGVSSTTVPSS